MEEFASKARFTIKFRQAYSPWSNSMNKQNHYCADIIVNKIMEEKRILVCNRQSIWQYEQTT